MTKKQRSSSINIPHYTLVIPATPSSFPLHPRHSRYTLVIPATPSSFPRRRESIGLGTPQIKTWIPACAGMTVVIGMTVGVGDGGMAGWRDGGMAGWRDGGMAGGRGGGVGGGGGHGGQRGGDARGRGPDVGPGSEPCASSSLSLRPPLACTPAR